VVRTSELTLPHFCRCKWQMTVPVCSRTIGNHATCHLYLTWPAGPKTLCNACGVKLVRKNRGTAEAKRRAAGEKAASAAAAAQLFMDRNSPSPEPWSTGGDSGADETPLAVDSATPSPCLQSSPRVHEPSPLGPQQLSRRPVRRAAAKAASRTAEYATTGDWPADEGVVPALGDAQSVRIRTSDTDLSSSPSCMSKSCAAGCSDGMSRFAATCSRGQIFCCRSL
jgi:hypothetical protein